MSWTYRSNTPPAYPIFKPVQEQPSNGKPRFREWGKRAPIPIELKLATERFAAPRTEIPLAPWEQARTPYDEPAQNGQTIRVMRDAEQRKGIK